jgi:hypothetical protein
MAVPQHPGWTHPSLEGRTHRRRQAGGEQGVQLGDDIEAGDLVVRGRREDVVSPNISPRQGMRHGVSIALHRNPGKLITVR